MKKVILAAIWLLYSTFSVAQSSQKPLKKFYLEIGGGSASHNGAFAEGGARAVFRNNWTACLSFYSIDMDPKNLPSDYKPGYALLLFIPIPDNLPSVSMNGFNITGGKLFGLGRTTWFTAEGGISIVSGEKTTFIPQQVTENWSYVSSNYSTQKESKTTIGGMLTADFNWAFTPYVGLSVGGFAIINSIQTTAGCGFKLIFGWLNTKKKSLINVSQ